jgi:hypothetical protein
MRAPCHSKANGASEDRSREWAQTEGTNLRRSVGDLLAQIGAARTVAAMTHTTPAPEGASISGVVLDLEALQLRYAIGKTKAGELVASPGFPRSVVPGMHRYPEAAIEAWELAHSLTGTVAEPAQPTPPMVISPPAPARPGRKPGSTKRAA